MFLLIRAGTAIGSNPQLLVLNRVILLRLWNLDHMLKHKKPSMTHTVNQFTMEGGKMKKSLDPAVHLLIFMKELLRLCPTFLQFRHSGRDTAELNVFLMPLSLMQLLLFLI